MGLDVFLTRQALADVDDIREWWSQNRSAEQAIRWHEACETAIDSLTYRAVNCPRAYEARNLPVEMRQLAFGVGRRRTHRLLFAIRPDKIIVYRVQHLAQREITIDDL